MWVQYVAELDSHHYNSEALSRNKNEIQTFMPRISVKLSLDDDVYLVIHNY